MNETGDEEKDPVAPASHTQKGILDFLYDGYVPLSLTTQFSELHTSQHLHYPSWVSPHERQSLYSVAFLANKFELEDSVHRIPLHLPVARGSPLQLPVERGLQSTPITHYYKVHILRSSYDVDVVEINYCAWR